MQGADYSTSATSKALSSLDKKSALESMMTSDNSNDRKRSHPHDQPEPIEKEEEDDQAHDEVRLWEDGFKDRYYESKFDVSADNLEFRYNFNHIMCTKIEVEKQNNFSCDTGIT